MGIVAWLGSRHLFSMIIGQDQDGKLKPGQRICHFVSLLLLWGACGFSIHLDSFWPLIIGVAVEYTLRKAIIYSGQKDKSTGNVN